MPGLTFFSSVPVGTAGNCTNRPFSDISLDDLLLVEGGYLPICVFDGISDGA